MVCAIIIDSSKSCGAICGRFLTKLIYSEFAIFINTTCLPENKTTNDTLTRIFQYYCEKVLYKGMQTKLVHQVA